MVCVNQAGKSVFIRCNQQLFKTSSTLVNLLVSVGFIATEKKQKKMFEVSEIK